MEDQTNLAVNFAKVACILIIGVIILSGFGNTDHSENDIKNSTEITFSGNPVDGDTITVDSNTFEFDTGDGVAGGHIAVQIGNTAIDTKENLQAAIEKYTDYKV